MRHILNGTEDPMAAAKKLNANFAELYSIAEASGATIESPAVVANNTQIAFSPVIQLDQVHHRFTMPARKVSNGLRFSVGPHPVNTAHVTVELIANGNQSCVPNFAEFNRQGDGEWVNDDGAVNVVTFSFMRGTAFYAVQQVAGAGTAAPA
jgi:hypothetical protein